MGIYGGEEVYVIRDETGTVIKLKFANMELERLTKSDYGYNFDTLPLKQPFNPLIASTNPPYQDTTLRTSALVDLTMIDPLLNMEVVYASKDNIFGTNLYNEARILLQQPVAEALFNIKRKIRSDNLGLVIHDAYRPWRTTNAIWNSVPDSLSRFFIPPEEGSCQNRGAAISVSLYRLNTGEQLTMPTEYGVLSSDAQAGLPIFSSRCP